MKYIKKYEDLKMTDLQSGDYVIIDCEDYDIDNELMIIMYEPEPNPDGFTIICTSPFEETESETFYDYEIVRKVSQEEAEMIMAMKKYNL